jgi:hypothetical protein
MGADLGEHEQVLVGAEGDGAGDEDEDAVLGPRGLAVDGVDLQCELLAEEERKAMGQRQLLFIQATRTFCGIQATRTSAPIRHLQLPLQLQELRVHLLCRRGAGRCRRRRGRRRLFPEIDRWRWGSRSRESDCERERGGATVRSGGGG